MCVGKNCTNESQTAPVPSGCDCTFEIGFWEHMSRDFCFREDRLLKYSGTGLTANAYNPAFAVVGPSGLDVPVLIGYLPKDSTQGWNKAG